MQTNSTTGSQGWDNTASLVQGALRNRIRWAGLLRGVPDSGHQEICSRTKLRTTITCLYSVNSGRKVSSWASYHLCHAPFITIHEVPLPVTRPWWGAARVRDSLAPRESFDVRQLNAHVAFFECAYRVSPNPEGQSPHLILVWLMSVNFYY
jgi:hypothetical protein